MRYFAAHYDHAGVRIISEHDSYTDALSAQALFLQSRIDSPTTGILVDVASMHPLGWAIPASKEAAECCASGCCEVCAPGSRWS